MYSTRYATEIDRVHGLPPRQFWIVHESDDYAECKREAEYREDALDPGQTVRVVLTSGEGAGAVWFYTRPQTL